MGIDSLTQSSQMMKSSEGRTERKDKQARISSTSFSLHVKVKSNTCLRDVFRRECSLWDANLILADMVAKSML